ncbi:hypothetical protein [Flavihumibacter fluvii]|uniref:hypothetical protein n=1 Tax=Flavihumibacter fluvii TaxID=2838157 RepID=UPI001EFB94CF|nr:hypothetical protein [Flavihumibacter fluvii]ULQ53395.1 hypothetical protein KJS93_03565 [Flavihumibacter fluvii]
MGQIYYRPGGFYAGNTDFKITVRNLSNEDEDLIVCRIRQIAEKTAEAAGATAIVELPYTVKYPITFNNIELTTYMLPLLLKSAGAGNVHLIPALFFRLGGMPKGKK